MEVAVMFALYELCGAGTNLAAGVVGARWGIRATLVGGLLMQVVGLALLYGWDDAWSKSTAIAYVTFAQALCGVAKDLVKLGGKTVTKLVTPEEKQDALFRLVSSLTGYKNSLKGVGYFLGAALLEVSYFAAIHFNVALVVLALPFAALGLSKDLGRVAKENIKLRSCVSPKPNINWLSFARFFCSAAGTCGSKCRCRFTSGARTGWAGREPPSAGARRVHHRLRPVPEPLATARPDASAPVSPEQIRVRAVERFIRHHPAVSGCRRLRRRNGRRPIARRRRARPGVVVAGLVAFALVFAVNSAVHSYLVVKYADGDKVAMNVGFYYMANAFGRLVGTIGSGALYSYVSADVDVGLAACFFAAIVFVALSGLVTTKIDDDEGGLRWGTKLRCLGARPWAEVEAERAREKAALAEEEARKGG